MISIDASSRITAFALLVMIVAGAGCAAPISESNEPGGDGVLFAEVVEETPPNASITPYDNASIQDSTYLGEAIREAVDSDDGAAVVTVPQTDVDDVKTDLYTLPLYVPESGSEYRHGYYVSFGDVVVIEFVIED